MARSDLCLPLQVNRIKVPRQLDELVEMQSETANPVAKAFMKVRAEIRGVGCFLQGLPARRIIRAKAVLQFNSRTALCNMYEAYRSPSFELVCSKIFYS